MMLPGPNCIGLAQTRPVLQAYMPVAFRLKTNTGVFNPGAYPMSDSHYGAPQLNAKQKK